MSRYDRPFGKRFSVSAFQMKGLPESLKRPPSVSKRRGVLGGILKRETLARELANGGVGEERGDSSRTETSPRKQPRRDLAGRHLRELLGSIGQRVITPTFDPPSRGIRRFRNTLSFGLLARRSAHFEAVTGPNTWARLCNLSAFTATVASR